jgi:early secretory antigenic target protein ESAT-6
MNDGLLLVNFAALGEASANIQRALNELQSQLSRLEEDGGRLTATWDGPARAAYEERQRRWQTAASDLSTILRNIQGAVEESKIDYQNTERMAAQRFE